MIIADYAGYTFRRLSGPLALLLLAGCARGPVLSESAERLTMDTRAVLADSADRLGVPGTEPRTLADLTQPCRDGTARKRYQAQIPLRRGASTAVLIDQATGMTLDLMSDRGYRLESPPGPGHRARRTFTMTRDAPAATLTVRLRGGKQPTLQLDGSTPCLPK